MANGNDESGVLTLFKRMLSEWAEFTAEMWKDMPDKREQQNWLEANTDVRELFFAEVMRVYFSELDLQRAGERGPDVATQMTQLKLEEQQRLAGPLSVQRRTDLIDLSIKTARKALENIDFENIIREKRFQSEQLTANIAQARFRFDREEAALDNAREDAKLRISELLATGQIREARLTREQDRQLQTASLELTRQKEGLEFVINVAQDPALLANFMGSKQGQAFIAERGIGEFLGDTTPPAAKQFFGSREMAKHKIWSRTPVVETPDYAAAAAVAKGQGEGVKPGTLPQRPLDPDEVTAARWLRQREQQIAREEYEGRAFGDLTDDEKRVVEAEAQEDYDEAKAALPTATAPPDELIKPGSVGWSRNLQATVGAPPGPGGTRGTRAEAQGAHLAQLPPKRTGGELVSREATIPTQPGFFRFPNLPAWQGMTPAQQATLMREAALMGKTKYEKFLKTIGQQGPGLGWRPKLGRG